MDEKQTDVWYMFGLSQNTRLSERPSLSTNTRLSEPILHPDGYYYSTGLGSSTRKRKY